MPVQEPALLASEGGGAGASTKDRNFGPTNRIRQIVWHIPWYGFRTQARLAADAGISPSSVSRMIRGCSQPTISAALKVTAALSFRLNRTLDLREVFSPDGTYPTPNVCDLVGCLSCMPPTAYDSDDDLKPEYRDVVAGTWSLPQRMPSHAEGGR
jgi:hypothetical protein